MVSRRSTLSGSRHGVGCGGLTGVVGAGGVVCGISELRGGVGLGGQSVASVAAQGCLNVESVALRAGVGRRAGGAVGQMGGSRLKGSPSVGQSKNSGRGRRGGVR